MSWQAPVPFHRKILGDIGDIAEWFRIVAPLEAGAMDGDMVVIARHSIFGLEV